MRRVNLSQESNTPSLRFIVSSLLPKRLFQLSIYNLPVNQGLKFNFMCVLCFRNSPHFSLSVHTCTENMKSSMIERLKCLSNCLQSCRAIHPMGRMRGFGVGVIVFSCFFSKLFSHEVDHLSVQQVHSNSSTLTGKIKITTGCTQITPLTR